MEVNIYFKLFCLLIVFSILMLDNYILEIVKICVLKYLNIFEVLFYYAVDVVFTSVTHYFIVFHSLFIYALFTFNDLITKYLLLLHFLIESLCAWPNFLILFLMINTICFWVYKILKS